MLAGLLAAAATPVALTALGKIGWGAGELFAESLADGILSREVSPDKPSWNSSRRVRPARRLQELFGRQDRTFVHALARCRSVGPLYGGFIRTRTRPVITNYHRTMVVVGRLAPNARSVEGQGAQGLL